MESADESADGRSRDGSERRRGSSYGRAGARWMVDPEAVWAPRLGRMLEPEPYAVLVTDVRFDGPGPRAIQTDAGFGRLTGFTIEALRGRPLDCLHGPRTDLRRFLRTRARVRRGRADAGVTVHYRREGTPVSVAWTVEPIRADGGPVTHLVWVLWEIDPESARGPATPRAGEPAVVVTSGSDERIVHANEAFTDLTGYPRDEVLGRRPSLLQGGDTAGAELERLRRARARGFPCRVELLNYRRDGRTFWNALDLLPVPDAGGRGTCWLAVQWDVTERKRQERRLQAAYHDELTGLPNRALAQARMERAIRMAHRNRGKVALLYVDLDRFHTLEPRFGRAALNTLLAEIGIRLQAVTRASDTLAYVGGDEFLVVAEDIASAEDGARIAGRLCAAASAPVAVDAAPVRFGATVGISLYPDHGGDPEQLVQRADAALIQARETGVGWSLYDPGRAASSLERVLVADELRRAIECDEFATALQPIVELETGRILAWEALARWHRPEEGWIPPSQFLPLAEARGLEQMIAARVQQLAFDAVAAWRSVLAPPVPGIAINVSGCELRAAGFVDDLSARIECAGLPFAAVELDVAAAVLQAADRAAVRRLERARALGITLALDDCGRDATIASLPLAVDRLKIDTALVRDVHVDPGRQRVVAGLIARAADHGLGTIAEGVETAEEAHWLARHGCRAAQGYYFGRPEVV